MAGPTVRKSAYSSNPSNIQPRLAASRMFHWLRSSERYHDGGAAMASDMVVSPNCCGSTGLLGLPFARRNLHRLDDLRVRGAATEIAGKIMTNHVVVGIGVLVEQLMGHQHEAGR